MELKLPELIVKKYVKTKMRAKEKICPKIGKASAFEVWSRYRKYERILEKKILKTPVILFDFFFGILPLFQFLY